MLKARSKKISLVLVLAMLMTMFAGLGVAGAATGYSATHVPLVSANDTAQNLGAVVVEFDNLPAMSTNEFVLKLPADFKLSATTFGGTYQNLDGTVYGAQLPAGCITKPTGGAGISAFALYALNTNQAIIRVVSGLAAPTELKVALNLNSVTVPTNAPEAINATLIAQPGSVFGDGVVQVAKTASGAVTALGGDPVTITSGGIDNNGRLIIYLRENKAEALKSGSKSFTLKLPQGFEWISYNFNTLGATGNHADFDIFKADTRTLEFNRTGTSAGSSIWVFSCTNIDVDESVAKFGDVEVTIGGASSVAPSSVVVGKYADYGVDIKIAKPDTKVIAGRGEQYVSDIKIEELIGDSLLDNRTIYLELPEGFRWMNGSWNTDHSGGVDFESISTVTNKPEQLKVVINDTGTTKGALEINRAQIQIAANVPNDTDVKVKFWGNAGISKEETIAKVVAPISATAEMKEIKIGLQKQVAGNIVITETEAEAIDSSVYGVSQPALTVALPFNVTWGNVPTVKVIEGDLQIGTVSTQDRVLNIPIKTSSSKASKLEISDITYTADRTVPEGDMKATFGGTSVVQVDFVNRDYVTKEVVAQCVTPAPGETIGSGEFRIGSNIYYAGGVAKVMDVAPYIKGDRTYVPMRYLGEILGAEVVWDDAARTVTLTKGDDVVVFTIGSTTYTINGEANTADVAPEISNDRTMLPARFVAEAFGATVGWDPATKTVLIQK